MRYSIDNVLFAFCKLQQLHTPLIRGRMVLHTPPYFRRSSLYLYDDENFIRFFSVNVTSKNVHFKSDPDISTFKFDKLIDAPDVLGLTNAPVGLNAQLGKNELDMMSILMQMRLVRDDLYKKLEESQNRHSLSIIDMQQGIARVVNQLISLDSRVNTLHGHINKNQEMQIETNEKLQLQVQNISTDNNTLKGDVRGMQNDLTFLKRKIMTTFP